MVNVWSSIQKLFGSELNTDFSSILKQLEEKESSMQEGEEENSLNQKSASLLLELEHIKNERIKLRLNFYRFLLGTLILGGVSLALNWQIQMFSLKQERDKRESEYLAQFINEALDVNLEKRLRFAHYFRSLILSEDVKSRWDDYYQDLRIQALEGSSRLAVLKNKRSALLVKANLPSNEEEELRILEAEISQLEGSLPDDFLLIPENWTAEELAKPITSGVDFTWSDATRGGSRIPQTLEQRDNIILLAQELQKVKNQLNKPIQVVSWYRSELVNTQIGGKPDSLHLTGLAVDITVEGMTPEQLIKELDWWPGGMYPGINDLLQLDLRGYPFRVNDEL
ncbi:D-Ala-D-Ala carboxypeptidase family metallohydrolase [Phormidium sp. FACHB-1136]|uniref:D-Ala-D-Ala carboxypeptidase family metallohydrolase n=1 Tax=Phormidium sp. FACHB-1136 TaxID=2692848 RepID=UPI0016845535|nr:D-Ala-D-Ala carboxypeptidase family metallohydrolase [Phormidium sp. FACHB-1136]MBD2428942.1 hypothetical protein [Phormidium sp. FACHB-1136]